MVYSLRRPIYTISARSGPASATGLLLSVVLGLLVDARHEQRALLWPLLRSVQRSLSRRRRCSTRLCRSSLFNRIRGMTGSYYRDYSAIIKGRFEGEEAVPCGPSSRKEPARIRNRKILKNGKTKRVCGGGETCITRELRMIDRSKLQRELVGGSRISEPNFVEIG